MDDEEKKLLKEITIPAKGTEFFLYPDLGPWKKSELPENEPTEEKKWSFYSRHYEIHGLNTDQRDRIEKYCREDGQWIADFIFEIQESGANFIGYPAMVKNVPHPFSCPSPPKLGSGVKIDDYEGEV